MVRKKTFFQSEEEVGSEAGKSCPKNFFELKQSGAFKKYVPKKKMTRIEARVARKQFRNASFTAAPLHPQPSPYVIELQLDFHLSHLTQFSAEIILMLEERGEK